MPRSVTNSAGRTGWVAIRAAGAGVPPRRRDRRGSRPAAWRPVARWRRSAPGPHYRRRTGRDSRTGRTSPQIGGAGEDIVARIVGSVPSPSRARISAQVAGISCISPIAPARLRIGRPASMVRPALSARMTRSIHATGMPNRADASHRTAATGDRSPRAGTATNRNRVAIAPHRAHSGLALPMISPRGSARNSARRRRRVRRSGAACAPA